MLKTFLFAQKKKKTYRAIASLVFLGAEIRQLRCHIFCKPNTTYPHALQSPMTYKPSQLSFIVVSNIILVNRFGRIHLGSYFNVVCSSFDHFGWSGSSLVTSIFFHFSLLSLSLSFHHRDFSFCTMESFALIQIAQN